MKQILNFLKDHAISITILTLVSLIVFLQGPELIFKEAYPFKTTEQRSYIVIFMWLGWALNLLFNDRSGAKPNRKTANTNVQKKLSKLKGRFESAIEFLTKTSIEKNNKKVSLIKLPWFLVVGPTGSGKSTLLANSNINFILSKQLRNSPTPAISHSDMVDLWVTRDLVLVDVPGAYLTTRNKNSSPTQIVYTLLWRQLLHLINKFNRKDALQGIIVTVNLPEILKTYKDQKNIVINNLKRRINDLKKEFGYAVPIHIVITKCDLLPGFLDFFGENSQEEIQQIWGVTLNETHSTHETIMNFNKRFNVLINRLNKQLLAKLHHERNSSLRANIKDFPLHIESLKENISLLIKSISENNLNIQGVYLTSGAQEGSKEEITYTSSALTNLDTHKALQLTTPPTPQSRSYFVKQLILQQLPATSIPFQMKRYYKNAWNKGLVYAASLTCVVTIGVFLTKDFQQGAKQTHALQNNLVGYQANINLAKNNSEHLSEALQLLTALKNATSASEKKKLVSFYSSKSQETADVLYEQALQTIIVPEIKRQFEIYLKQRTNHSPENIYSALSAYLMLGDKNNFKQDILLKEFYKIVPNSLSENTIEKLKPHLKMALQKNGGANILNDNLIFETRNYLFNLSPAKLGYIILKNKGRNADLASAVSEKLISSHLFDKKPGNVKISLMYTGTNFKNIVDSEVKATANEILYGNSVLGMQTLPPNSLPTHELEVEILSLYISNYVAVWENVLSNVRLGTPKNLAEVNSMVLTLTSQNSPLITLLETFKTNTSFTQVLNRSPKLQQLSLLLADGTTKKPGNLYGDFVSLRQLQRYVDDMAKSNQLQKAVFEATAKRMQDSTKDPLTQIQVIANTNPEPMKTWLNEIAANTWSIMIKETSQYIDDTWQLSIMHTYNTMLKDKYPLDPTATEEVNLQQFIYFLGKNGTLSKFQELYLKPFITTKNKKKTWKILNGEQLPFSNKVLQNFANVSSLQKAFFPNDDNKLYVPFTLKPIYLDKKMKSFTLNINGQEIIYNKDMPRVVGWPGKNKLHASAIHFIKTNNKLLSNKVEGDWGWFRLVEKANQKVKSEKEIILSFNINGHKAKYLLSTKSNVNPFLLKNFDKFDLPEHLLAKS